MSGPRPTGKKADGNRDKRTKTEKEKEKERDGKVGVRVVGVVVSRGGCEAMPLK